jgi:outer membrane protein
MKNFKRVGGIFLFALFVISGSAQTDAGKFLIGGSSTLSFMSSTYKWKNDDANGTDSKEIAFNLAPQFGYFVIDGLVAGLEIQMGFTKSKPEDVENGDETVTLMAAGPFARYYYGTSKIKPYGQAGIFVGLSADKYYDFYEDADVTDKTGIFGYQFKAGAGFFFNDNVSLDMGFSFTNMSAKPKEDNDTNYKDIVSQFGFEAGIIVIL